MLTLPCFLPQVMQVIGVGVAMFVIDRVGRKKLLYFGSIACFVCVSLPLPYDPED